MNSRSAGLLPLVLLVLLAGISYWLEGISRFAPERARQAARGVPDFVMDRFRSVQTGGDGRPLYTITAEQLRHYAPTEQSELSRAELRDLTPERPPLTVRAETARYLHLSEVVHFAQQVVMIREAWRDTPRMTLTTSDMTVLPREGKASGKGALTLRDDTMQVSAVGFDADKNARIVRLHSKVKAVYVAPNKRVR